MLAYSIAVRRHEFGVRMALGAEAAQVARESCARVWALPPPEPPQAWLGRRMTARLLQDQLYGVDPRDPMTYGAALALILVSAVRRVLDSCASRIGGERRRCDADRVSTGGASQRWAPAISSMRCGHGADEPISHRRRSPG